MGKKTKNFVIKKSFTRKEALFLYNLLQGLIEKNNDICYYCTIEHLRERCFPECKSCEFHIPSSIFDLGIELQMFLYPPKNDRPRDDDLPF